MKLVEDVTREEVSEMHARSVLVGILDPVTRQHTTMNHSKSYKIVQEFANHGLLGVKPQDGQTGLGSFPFEKKDRWQSNCNLEE